MTVAQTYTEKTGRLTYNYHEENCEYSNDNYISWLEHSFEEKDKQIKALDKVVQSQ
jgi:hypothetical protein